MFDFKLILELTNLNIDNNIEYEVMLKAEIMKSHGEIVDKNDE